MKRSTLLLICLLVFVALVGGAAAWMYFSPGGALAPVTAEDAVPGASRHDRYRRMAREIRFALRAGDKRF